VTEQKKGETHLEEAVDDSGGLKGGSGVLDAGNHSAKWEEEEKRPEKVGEDGGKKGESASAAGQCLCCCDGSDRADEQATLTCSREGRVVGEKRGSQERSGRGQRNRFY
jgi:hypothetical protein